MCVVIIEVFYISPSTELFFDFIIDRLVKLLIRFLLQKMNHLKIWKFAEITLLLKHFYCRQKLNLSTSHWDCIVTEVTFFLYCSYSPENKEVKCFNSLVSEARPLTSQSQSQCDIFKPELAVPVRMGHKATRSHCALHVLGMIIRVNISYYKYNQTFLKGNLCDKEKVVI